MDLALPYRYATRDDALALAELTDMAGEGMPSYLWANMAEPGETALDVGQRRARREDGSFSYRNAVVLEQDGKVIAGLIGYALPDRAVPIDYDKMPAAFVPLQELENLAPGTWYVNVLATYPDHRGRGHGTGLLAIAGRIASELERPGLSIIVSDANVGARRLYEACGYRQIAERPMAKDGFETPGEAWVLLVKTF